MSNSSEEKNLDRAQTNQKDVGDASSNPKTAGPAENLRERAAELNTDEDSQEPA